MAFASIAIAGRTVPAAKHAILARLVVEAGNAFDSDYHTTRDCIQRAVALVLGDADSQNQLVNLQARAGDRRHGR